MKISDCCGAPPLYGNDDPICSQCLEHCELFEELTAEDRREQRGEYWMDSERNGD